MEILGSIFLALFVILLIVTAATFGFALLSIFVAMTVMMAAFLIIRGWWHRWRFTHPVESSSKAPGVVEGEYKDISDNK